MDKKILIWQLYLNTSKYNISLSEDSEQMPTFDISGFFL